MLLNDIEKSTIATITASNETASVTLQSEIVPMCQEDIDFYSPLLMVNVHHLFVPCI